MLMGSGTETLGDAVNCLNDTLHLAEIAGLTVPHDRCHPILAGRSQMATPHDGPSSVHLAPFVRREALTPRFIAAHAPEVLGALPFLDRSRTQEREQRSGAPFVRIGPRSSAGTAPDATIM